MTETERLPENLLPSPAALAGKRVLVLGLGESGLAMINHLVDSGVTVRVADSRVEPPRLAECRRRFPGADVATGEFSLDLLEGIDAVCVSPGVSIEQGSAVPLVDTARAGNRPVWGELDLFMAAVQAFDGPAPKVVAITGTNGKTTVTALTAALAQAADRRVRAAGNIGPAMLDAWQQALASHDLPEIWVLELSSFQLAIAAAPVVDAATILNVTQDHLDWHASFDSYRAAKAKLASQARIFVVCRDDPPVAEIVAGAGPTVGLDAPTRIDDFGLVSDGGMAWLAYAEADDDGLPRKRGAPAPGVRLKRLMPADALRIRGTHNRLNALTALALANAVDVPMADMLHALREYRGEPHRCKLIACIDDIEFIDDSKGTNVGATVAALGGSERPVWLIAGGRGKGQDFTPLRAAVMDKALGVFLIGESAADIAEAVAGAGITTTPCIDLPEAVSRAMQAAAPGQSVLLSPACASFDMFEHYRARGEAFAECVRELAAERGMMLELPC